MKLDYHIVKSLVNGFLGLFVNPKTRPTFFEIRKTYPSLERITAAYPVIRTEFERLTANIPALPQYHELDPGESKIAGATAERWNVLMLEILGHKPAGNRARFPETCRVLDSIPDMIQAFFSILDPGKSVPEHEGPYLGYLRYHLGIEVPKRDPPTLIVNSKPYVWKEGEGVLFDDSWPHSVVNHSREPRVVLIVDVRRPLPRFADLCNRFMLNVLARHTYGRKVARKAEQFANAQLAEPKAAA